MDDEAFRAELRDFCLTQCPPEIRALVARNGKLGRREWSTWQRILFERGWGRPTGRWNTAAPAGRCTSATSSMRCWPSATARHNTTMGCATSPPC
ncbi:hypothetical protein ACFQU7_08135 [Pseudoroseomonas wenyumeiae]